MNNPSARFRVAITLVTVVVFLPVLSVFALVNQKNSGTQFSIIQGKGTAENVADGRRFSSQRDPLKIRGTLLLPPYTHSQQQKMSRLAIHFHGRPTGPTVRSVQLCDGTNCKYKYATNLRGDYSTRETVYSNSADYGNVWVFNPPEMVGPQFAVVLEITFPGIIDEGSIPRQDLEFTLTSVDVDFPDANPVRMGNPKVGLGGNTTTLNRSIGSATAAGGAASAAAGAAVGAAAAHPVPTPSVRVPATTTSIWPTGKAYFFKGERYVRYDVATNKADPDYPQPIAGHWPGFPPEFEKGIDAEVMWNNGKVYFFKGDQYLRYDIASDKVEAGYPQSIVSHWPGVWSDHIDAGVVWPNGKAYFFKGDQYIRYDLAADKADPGYPQAISSHWNGFPANFQAGIDNVVVWNNGKAYFFKGREYLRYDIASDKVDDGPAAIVRNWHGLW
jgi:hypothetical protein